MISLYNDIIVPFMAEEEIELPELDLETNEGSKGMTPFWQEMKKDMMETTNSSNSRP